MPDSPKSHLVTENAGPSKLEGRTAVHLDAPAADRQRRDRALKTSEIRYRRLFETAPYAILVLDAETGMIVDLNSAACRLLGSERDEIVGRALWSLPAFKNAAATRSQFQDVVRRPHMRYDDLPLETRDGQIRHVELVSVLFLADNKQFVQCTIRDITERVHREQEDGVRAEQEELQVTLANRRTVADTTHDEATGLANRWYLEETLPRELHRASRAKAPLTLTVLAPDPGAKPPPPDAMLREVGRVIREHLRKSDMAARYAGHEFVIVLADSSPQATIERVEQIRSAVRGLEVLHGEQRLSGPVVSAGVASVRARLASTREMLDAACTALAAARKAGGDRTVLHQTEEKTRT